MKNLLYIFCAIILIEITGNLLSIANVEPTGWHLYMNNEWADGQNAYADRDSTVGVWHSPNDVWIQSGPCFTVKMQSNRFGATDNEWNNKTEGFLFLGASLIEGYGINYGNRLSEVYEDITHKEVFNCGMSGKFNLVQSFLTLKKFDTIIKFDTCFVFLLLPEDEDLTKQVPKERLRPYLQGDSIVYSYKTAFKVEKPLAKKMQLFLEQFSYSYHIYKYFTDRNFLKSKVFKKSEEEVFTDFPATHKVLNMFSKTYPDKYFIYVLLPSVEPKNIEFTFPESNNARLIDMRNSLDIKNDYFICDRHWNERGHRKFAQALFNEVKRTN